MSAWWWHAQLGLALAGGVFTASFLGVLALQRLTSVRLLRARAWVIAGRAAMTVVLMIATVPKHLRIAAPQALSVPTQVWSAPAREMANTFAAHVASPIAAIQFPFVALAVATSAVAFVFAFFQFVALARSRRRWRVHKRVRRASVRLNTELAAPFAFRVGMRAEVVMPLDLLAQPRTERHLLLRHEFAHHRNGDTLWAWPLALIRALFVLNPFVHLWVWSLRELEEIAADSATTQPVLYSQTLLAAAWRTLGAPRAGHAANRSLERRVRIMLLKKKTVLPVIVAGLMIVLMTTGAAAVATTQLGAYGKKSILVQVLSGYYTLDSVHLSELVRGDDSQQGYWMAMEGPTDRDGAVTAAMNRLRQSPEKAAFVRAGIARLRDPALASLLARKLEQYGLPPAARAVAVVESGAQNLPGDSQGHTMPDGAHGAGMWMFIEPTARNFGLTVNAQRDERLDVDLETDAALRYLASLHLRFRDYRLAVMAYNQGEAAVQAAIDATGSRDPEVLVAKGGLNHYLADVEAVALVLAAPELLE